jgi:hypothetical protein
MEQLQKEIDFILKELKIKRTTCEFCKEQWLATADNRLCSVCNVVLHPNCSYHRCVGCGYRFCPNHFKICNECEGCCQQCLLDCQCCPCQHCYNCYFDDDIQSCLIHKICHH